MRSTPYFLVVLSLLFSVVPLCAQSDEQATRDVPEEIVSLLVTASSAQQSGERQEAISRMLPALAGHYQDELNGLVDGDGQQPFVVTFADGQPESVARIFSIALADRLIHLVQLQSEVQVYSVDISRERLASAIRYYLQELQISSSFNGMERGSAELFRWTVQPYLNDLREAEVEKLIFTPSATLRRLPLTTMLDGRRYLIDEFEISVSLGVQQRAAQGAFSSTLRGESNYLVNTLSEDIVLSQSQRVVNQSFPILQLQSSHLFAGASANLVSLWPANAAFGEQLLESFSAEVEQGASYSEALRTAQREVKSSGRFGHAFFWGSYLLVE